MSAYKTLKKFNFIILITFSSFSFGNTDNYFKYFIAGDHAAMQSILTSIEAFDPNWTKQIGSILSTLNLDPQYQKLNQEYKSCIFNVIQNEKSLDIDLFFKKTEQECNNKLSEIHKHIKSLFKKTK